MSFFSASVSDASSAAFNAFNCCRSAAICLFISANCARALSAISLCSARPVFRSLRSASALAKDCASASRSAATFFAAIDSDVTSFSSSSLSARSAATSPLRSAISLSCRSKASLSAAERAVSVEICACASTYSLRNCASCACNCWRASIEADNWFSRLSMPNCSCWFSDLVSASTCDNSLRSISNCRSALSLPVNAWPRKNCAMTKISNKKMITISSVANASTKPGQMTVDRCSRRLIAAMRD